MYSFLFQIIGMSSYVLTKRASRVWACRGSDLSSRLTYWSETTVRVGGRTGVNSTLVFSCPLCCVRHHKRKKSEPATHHGLKTSFHAQESMTVPRQLLSQQSLFLFFRRWYVIIISETEELIDRSKKRNNSPTHVLSAGNRLVGEGAKRQLASTPNRRRFDGKTGFFLSTSLP